MRTPPDGLSVEQLALLLADAWAFPVVDLRYAPLGFGSHHWVAADTYGVRRFVTVDDLGHPVLGDTGAGLARLRRSLLTAHTLRETAGLPFVVAPLLAADETVLQTIGPRYAAAVYPFVDGHAYPEGEQSTSQDRAAVVELLAQLHDATPTAAAVAGVDDLELPGRADLERALGRLQVPWDAGPFAEATRDLLASTAADVRVLLQEYDRLVELARTGSVPWVITHGEPKADNFLVTAAGAMLIDWDTALVAPAARDLWMVEAGAGEECSTYTERTGRRVTDDELTLYRLRWDLADIASFVQWFTTPHSGSADTDIAWNALTQTLRLKDRWPELL